MSNRPVATKKHTPPRPGQRKAGSSANANARVRHAQQAEDNSRRWFIVGAVLFVVAAILAIAVLATRTGDEADNSLVTAAVSVAGTSLPPMPEGRPGEPAPNDPAVGMAVPVLTGSKLDGSAAIAMPVPGKPAVLMFLAHWCPHCQAEVPVITDHLNGTMPSGVDLYSVSTAASEDRPNFPPGRWLKRENWPVPTMVDDEAQTAANAYGLTGFPFFVAVDAQGKVVERRSGELTTAQFDAMLASARGTPAQ